MAEQFQGNVDTLFKGMESFVTSKTCVGDPIRIGDTIILPLVDVSFGMMASTKNEKDRRNGGGGVLPAVGEKLQADTAGHQPPGCHRL